MGRKMMGACLTVLMVSGIIFQQAGIVWAAPPLEMVETSLSYQDIDFGFTDEELQADGTKMQAETYALRAPQPALPAVYDPRIENPDSLLPLRDQNPYGCCWTFSALGACEASLVAKGIATNEIDLSERHLAYYFYKKGPDTADALGGTLGDYNTNISSSPYLDIGGNSLLTIWHLASWCGPVSENSAPFAGLIESGIRADEGGLMGQANSTQMAYGSDAFHLQNAYVISVGDSYEDASQRDTVKQLILQYGALGMSYYAERNSIYDNVENDCYYYDGNNKYKTNHAIQVVGWDDTFPKEAFQQGHRPDGDGAWLMKNSWGGEGGALAQNGYFWLSYYDYSLRDASGATQKLAYVYDCEPADNYDTIYQHDGDAGHRRFGAGNSLYKMQYLANVFVAKAEAGYRETLQAVGIGVSVAGAAYTLKIYTDLTEDNNPESGTLVHTQQGSIPFNGYHTIELNQDVVLDYGQRYAVVFEFKEGVYAYASRCFANSPWEFFSANTKGLSFVRSNAAADWIDCADNETYDSCALRIKAYTDTDKADQMPELVSLSMSSETLAMEAGQTQQLSTVSVYSDGNPRATIPTWSSSDENTASVSKYGMVTAVRGGQAVITADVGGIKAQCVVTVTEAKDTPPVSDTTDPSDAQNVADSSHNTGSLNHTDSSDEQVTPARLLSLSMSQSAVSIENGKTYELSAEPLYSQENATEWMVYWKSSNTSVASVNNCGCVTAKKPGKAVITVYNGDVQAACTVTVLPKKQVVAKTSVTKNKLTLTLTKQSGVDGYVICRSTSEGSGYKAVKTLKGASNVKYTGAVLNNKKPYYYKVRAYKVIDGKKKYGAYSKVYTSRPDKAVLTKVTTPKKAVAKLTWKKTAEADGYLIYRSTKKSGGYKKVATVRGGKTLSYTDKNLKTKKTYYYKIRAWRKIDGKTIYGAYSAISTVRTK